MGDNGHERYSGVADAKFKVPIPPLPLGKAINVVAGILRDEAAAKGFDLKKTRGYTKLDKDYDNTPLLTFHGIRNGHAHYTVMRRTGRGE